MTSLSERSEQKRYEKKKKRNEKVKRTLAIGTIVIVVGFVLFYVFFQMNRTYGSYAVVNSIKRADSNSVKYISYEGNILKYSKDGASAMKPNGEILWNGSYEFKNPIAVTCGNYVAIADIGGKEIYVFNGNDTGTKLSVQSPIEQIAVANQGVVAAVLENDDEARINIYDPYSVTEQLKVSVSTSTDSDGYPVAIALSPDGLKLVTSYINISNGVLQSSINFYNFDEVGQSSVDRIVGSRPMDREIVANIEFMNSEVVCAYTENGFRLYRLQETPQDIAEINVEKNIKSVCHNKQYLGIVLENPDDMDKPYTMQIYDTDGNMKLEKNVDYNYDKVAMGEDEMIFYSDKTCNIVRVRGSEKFDCTFDDEISGFFSIGSSDKYVLIDGENIDEIRLTGRAKGE